MEVRSLLNGLPADPGIYESGPDAVVEILEAAAVAEHRHIEAVFPPSQALEHEFSSGPIFVYSVKDAIVNLASGAVYDAQGRLIREAFGTGQVLNRYLKGAELPDLATIPASPWPVIPLATTRSNNFCRWWLDSMAKDFLVGRSSLAKIGALPMIHGPKQKFQRESLFLLDDFRALAGTANPFVRADIVSSSGVSYNGGQSIGELVVDLGRHFAQRGLDPNQPQLPKRIYVSRRKAKIRRVAEEDAFAAALAADGFATIQLEKMTLQQQMAQFAQAEVIVAPHGAGLTNLLWANPNVTLVEIFPEGGVHGSAFLRIASQMGLRYFAMVGAAGQDREGKGNPNNADIILDQPAALAFIRGTVLAPVEGR